MNISTTTTSTTTEKRICADCGQTFTLTQADIDFFLGRQLQIPRRCQPCRHERRRAASAELGLSKGGRQ